MLLVQPLPLRAAGGAELPEAVAGVALPRTPLAQRAAAFGRVKFPDYLFNHCMRTYVFGALLLKRSQPSYPAEDAFIGALFHDSGLLPEFATSKGSFEVDGADAAERWVRENGGSAALANRVWYAVALHDGDPVFARRQGPEALLVLLGAGADVDGLEPGELEARQIAEVLAAFPRLQFKRRFTELLTAHCTRKPNSQNASWLERLCDEHAPHPPPADAVEREIAASSFTE
ncbi:MAG TPA: hypothetical protein VGN03_14805 [Steroidobacteraceae bacterium]